MPVVWLANTRALTDGSQAVVTMNNFDAFRSSAVESFGNMIGFTGSSGNPYKYDGLWRYRDDGDFGLLHVGAILAGSSVCDASSHPS